LTLPRLGVRCLVTLGAATVLAACALAEAGPHVTPTSVVQLPAKPTRGPSTPETSVATWRRVDESRALAPVASSPPAQSQPSVDVSRDASPKSKSDPLIPAPLRLPTAEDLGLNYFELFAERFDSTTSAGGLGQSNVALVAFGYSERAKLPDERVERDGPLAAVIRVSRHSSSASAFRFAAASGTANGPDVAATDGSAKWLGLAAELRQSHLSTHEIAPDFTATRTLQAGWFAALDGSRVPTEIEQWTAVRARTVLTVVLVWGSQVTDGWGRSLIQRLARTAGAQAATHGP